MKKALLLILAKILGIDVDKELAAKAGGKVSISAKVQRAGSDEWVDLGVLTDKAVVTNRAKR